MAYPVVGSDAEDVVQEAFVRAHRHLGRYDPSRPFRPWLLKIVANEALNWRRAAGRRVALALRDSGRAALGPELTEDVVVERERAAVLAAAVAALRPNDRLVIACRWFAQLSEAETAEVLDCRVGTVKSRSSRALDRLRKELGDA